MPDWIFKNKPTAYATLASPSGTSGATLTLTTGHGTRLPAPGAGQISAVRIENELITYTGNSGDVLTGVTRGAGATNHVAGTEVKNVLVEEWANAVTALSTDTKAALAGTSGTPQAANPYVTNADPRNADARTPTAHSHIEGDTTGLVADLAARVLSTDSRLSDARTPTAHAPSHKATGGDVLAGIVGGYAPLDSGLLVPIANLGTGTPTGLKFLRDDRVWAVPAGGGGGGFTNPMTDGGDLIVGAFIDAYAYLGQDTSGWSQAGSGDGSTYEFAREFSCSQPKLVSGFGWYRQSGDGTPTAFHLFDTTTSTSVLTVTTGIPSTGTGWLWVDCSASGVYLVAGRHYRVSRTRAGGDLWEQRTGAPTPDSGITDYGGYLGTGGGVYPTGSDSRWFGVSIRLGSGVTGAAGTPVRKALGATGSTLTVDGNLSDGMSWLPAGQVLTDAATIAWDVTASHNAQVTLGGNRTLAAPTNMVAGQVHTLRVVQDGTGSRTLTWNSAYKFGATPTLPTAANAVAAFEFVTDGTNVYCVGATVETLPIGGGGGDWTLIQSAIRASNGLISFTSIPVTYKHLMLVFAGRIASGASTSNLEFQLNGDTGANYDFTGSGTATGQNQGRLAVSTGDASAAGLVGGLTAYFFDYARTVYYKAVSVVSGQQYNVNTFATYQHYNVWHSTAAITQITIITTLETGSRAELYGLS